MIFPEDIFSSQRCSMRREQSEEGSLLAAVLEKETQHLQTACASPPLGAER